MPARKVHYVDGSKDTLFNENEKTLCGKIMKSKGLIDPLLEYDRQSFLHWGKVGRCKICEKRMHELYSCPMCEKDMEDCKCTNEDFFGPEDELMK